MPSTDSRAPDFSVAGRRVLITGASRGIGRAVAEAFRDAGANVLGLSRTDPGIQGVRWVHADLAIRADVDRVLAEHTEGLDAIICNAGIAYRAPAEVHSDDGWDSVLEVDLTSQFRLVREVGSRMLDRGSGSVVWIASMMSFQGGKNVVSYAAAKSAVPGVVRALANEWAGRGVRVNAVAPGYVLTELTEATHSDSARAEQFVERIPLGRWARPEDITGAVVFLCSPAAAYIHGVTLPVDGGWLTR